MPLPSPTLLPGSSLLPSGQSVPSNAFITVGELSDMLGIDVTADPGATLAVEAACDTCRTVAGQLFTSTVSDVITLDGSGTEGLPLPATPISAAGTVTVNGGTVTDYVLDTSNGILYRGTAGNGYWPLGRQNVQITYDHGTSPVPADVRMVALQIAMRLAVQGITSDESVGDVRVKYAVPGALDLTAGELRILRKYRRLY